MTSINNEWEERKLLRKKCEWKVIRKSDFWRLNCQEINLNLIFVIIISERTIFDLKFFKILILWGKTIKNLKNTKKIVKIWKNINFCVKLNPKVIKLRKSLQLKN